MFHLTKWRTKTINLMPKSITTILLSIMMLLFALGLHAQMPLGVTPHREFNSKPVDNSLLGRRQSQQRQLNLARQGSSVQVPRCILPSGQRKAPFTTTAGAVFRGTIISNLAWPPGKPQYGIYEVSSVSPDLNAIYLDQEGIMYAEYGSAIIGTNYWMVIGYDFGGYGTIYVKYKFDLAKMEWDANASQIIPNQDYKYLAWTNTPYDKETKRAYGYFYTSDGQSLEFCKMDYATLNRVKIADPSHLFIVMAIDENSGQLYAIDSEGDLYKIDKTNGNETLVGSTGFIPSSYHQAAAIDGGQGKLYWAFLEEDLTSGIAEVDLRSADAFKCYEFDNTVQFGDLYLTSSGIDDGAPSMVEDLSWQNNAANPNLIDLSFTMPVLTNNASDFLGEDLRYIVKLGDSEVASGPATPGEHKTLTIEGLPVSQALQLGVCAANNVGEGGVSVVDVWAGFDTPAAPTEVRLAIDGGNINLTWTPSTTGMHGGYVIPGNVRYHVYTEPDGELAATTEATSYTSYRTPEDLRYLSFSVDAFSTDFPTPSEKSYSNKEALGEHITPAYEVRFDDINKIESYWTILDNNHDGETWYLEDTYDVMRIRMGSRGNNDWMLSPPLYLEKGKHYSVEFDASTAYGGKMRMAYGKASLSSPAKYTELMAGTNIAADVPTTYRAMLTVEETGDYRIGLQEMASGGIYTELYRFSIGDGVSDDAPAAPTDLKVTPAPEGALGATISFTAPSLTFNGSPLTHIDNIQLFREGTLIHTIDQDVAPGKSFSFTDNTVTAMGITTYSVRAVNENGVGEMASSSAYIGFDVPSSPSVVNIIDNGNGTVTINWENSVVGRNGGFVDVSKVENTLYNVENNQLTKAIVTLTGKNAYTCSATLSGDPAWYYIGVTAKYADTAESDATLGRLIKGTPAGIPIEDSFASQQIHDSRFWWGTPLVGATNWGLSATSADNDGGSMMFVSKAESDKAVVGTRKITLQGSSSPKLFFKYYSQPSSTGSLTLQIDRGQRGIIDDVAVFDLAADNPDGGWKQATVDLEEYTTDKYVILRFLAAADAPGTQIGFDDFRLGEYLAHDLCIEVDAPATILAGQTADIKMVVTNVGSIATGDFSVDLTFDDQQLSQITGTGLAAGGQQEMHFSLKTDVFMKGDHTLKATVHDPADQQSHNDSATFDIAVGNYPSTAIVDLAAEGPNSYVHLSWTNPADEVRTLSRITEDFEGYTPWATDFAPWTCVDRDGGLSGGIFSGVSYPGQGTPIAFMIFNPNNLTSNATQQVPELTPRSGKQYAAAIYSVNPSTNAVVAQDNWLVSPRLPGVPQTITLYVKTMNTAYPNAQLEMLYSTTGAAEENFIKMGDSYLISDVSNWTKIQVTLPIGTSYFALRDITSSDDAFMVMVDDVDFMVEGQDPLPITGYNVYVDHQLQTVISGGEQTSYDLGPLSDGSHQIQMTILYGPDQLESEPSNVALVTTTIKAITPAEADQLDVTVYDMSGRVVAEGRQVISRLPRNVYIVRVKATGEVMKMER